MIPRLLSKFDLMLFCHCLLYNRMRNAYKQPCPWWDLYPQTSPNTTFVLNLNGLIEVVLNCFRWQHSLKLSGRKLGWGIEIELRTPASNSTGNVAILTSQSTVAR